MSKIAVFIHALLLHSRGAIERRDHGATSVEYAIMAGVIAVGVIGSFWFFTTKVAVNFNRVPQTWV